MKSSILYTVISLLPVLLFSGCAPELAQTKYGPEETQWKDYISKSYQQWEPPATPPPLSVEKVKKDTPVLKAETSIEIIPEPMIKVEGKVTEPDLVAIEPEVKTAVGFIPEKGINAHNKPVKPLLKDVTYKVQKGDTLWTISKKFYDNGKYWEKIQEANKAALPSADSLKAGMDLTIPAK